MENTVSFPHFSAFPHYGSSSSMKPSIASALPPPASSSSQQPQNLDFCDFTVPVGFVESFSTTSRQNFTAQNNNHNFATHSSPALRANSPSFESFLTSAAERILIKQQKTITVTDNSCTTNKNNFPNPNLIGASPSSYAAVPENEFDQFSSSTSNPQEFFFAIQQQQQFLQQQLQQLQQQQQQFLQQQKNVLELNGFSLENHNNHNNINNGPSSMTPQFQNNSTSSSTTTMTKKIQEENSFFASDPFQVPDVSSPSNGDNGVEKEFRSQLYSMLDSAKSRVSKLEERLEFQQQQQQQQQQNSVQIVPPSSSSSSSSSAVSPDFIAMLLNYFLSAGLSFEQAVMMTKPESLSMFKDFFHEQQQQNQPFATPAPALPPAPATSQPVFSLPKKPQRQELYSSLLSSSLTSSPLHSSFTPSPPSSSFISSEEKKKKKTYVSKKEEKNPNGYVPKLDVVKYTPEQKRAVLDKYKIKRQNRTFKKKIRYQKRKVLADNRPRFKGRFCKRLPQDNEEEDNENEMM